ncbi:MAG: methyltransferase [Planctomycetaceae bacterium]|jgi:hypothetical protein|nr:methyltransferase [Phycisphaerales bacterium]MCE2652967.1 methyltransferase [Planctomycetaceae bacterium]
MQRRLSHEFMDDPDVDPVQLARALRYIRLVNRLLGGQSALLSSLRRWSAAWPAGRPVTLLDIATGSADLPIAARAWALKAGFDLRITAVDVHEKTLADARAQLAAQPPAIRDAITLLPADAFDLVERFGPASFDYVHAGLFLHHLPDLRALTMLRIMDRLARHGLIWNDLVRSRVAHLAIRLLTLGQPPIVRHDARVSVEAGFTRAEALDMAARLGLPAPRYRASLTYRFTLTSEKPTP